MKTIEFQFTAEMPDGDVITSKVYEYKYNKKEDDTYGHTDNYDCMLDDMENDKIVWIIKTMNVTHELIKE